MLPLVCAATLVLVTGVELGQEALDGGASGAVTVSVGGETTTPWFDTPLPGPVLPHGIGRVRYQDRTLLPGRLGFEVDYNTDALYAAVSAPELLGTGTYLQWHGRLQSFAHNLLIEHARGGVAHYERGFIAPAAWVGMFGSRRLLATRAMRAAFDVGLDARVHGALPIPLVTSPALVLPPPSPAVEPSLAFRAESATRVTSLRRLHGATARVGVRGIGRASPLRWGALGDDDDGRNNVGQLGGLADAQGRVGLVGAALGPLRATALGIVRAGVGSGLDDRDRFRLGGENDWVVPLAGAGWAEFLVDRYAMAGVRSGVVFRGAYALDVGFDAATFNDPLRDGSADMMGRAGGAFVEGTARIGDDASLRARVAQGVGLPRRFAIASPKFFVLFEMRLAR